MDGANTEFCTVNPNWQWTLLAQMTQNTMVHIGIIRWESSSDKTVKTAMGDTHDITPDNNECKPHEHPAHLTSNNIYKLHLQNSDIKTAQSTTKALHPTRWWQKEIRWSNHLDARKRQNLCECHKGPIPMIARAKYEPQVRVDFVNWALQ